MPTLRLPLAEQFTNRDSSAQKDAKLTNCFVRNVGGKPIVVKRPGLTSYATNTVGQGQGMYYFGDSLYAISGGILTRNKAGVITTYALAVDSLLYDFNSSVLSNLVVFKSSANMYTFNPTTLVLTHVTSANYPATTVRGLVYLDGYFIVATSTGQIHNSSIEDPTTWAALEYISAEIGSDSLVAVNKILNYVVAIGARTTEFFYDAANPTGSPLASVSNAFNETGCANGDSVVHTGSHLLWVIQTSQRGRQVVLLEGFTPQIVSTPEIEIILNADNLSAVYSYAIKFAGTNFYVLTLENTNITLVYDMVSKMWWNASSMHLNATTYPSSYISTGNGVVTFTVPNHGLVSGDSVLLQGATPTSGNTSYPIVYIDANTFNVFYTGTLNPIIPFSTTAQPDYAIPDYSIPDETNISTTTYTEGYVQATYYATDGVKDYLQGEGSGKIYVITPTAYTDDGTFINMIVRTNREDGGNSKRKFLSRIEVIADKVPANGYIRYSDDDYVTWTACPAIDLNTSRSLIRRAGNFRRRAFEFRFTDPQPLRIEALELDVEQGGS
jgi:hypothetical protein